MEIFHPKFCIFRRNFHTDLGKASNCENATAICLHSLEALSQSCWILHTVTSRNKHYDAWKCIQAYVASTASPTFDDRVSRNDQTAPKCQICINMFKNFPVLSDILAPHKCVFYPRNGPDCTYIFKKKLKRHPRTPITGEGASSYNRPPARCASSVPLVPSCRRRWFAIEALQVGRSPDECWGKTPRRSRPRARRAASWERTCRSSCCWCERRTA